MQRQLSSQAQGKTSLSEENMRSSSSSRRKDDRGRDAARSGGSFAGHKLQCEDRIVWCELLPSREDVGRAGACGVGSQGSNQRDLKDVGEHVDQDGKLVGIDWSEVERDGVSEAMSV
jgi:hypothetical protein